MARAKQRRTSPRFAAGSPNTPRASSVNEDPTSNKRQKKAPHRADILDPLRTEHKSHQTEEMETNDNDEVESQGDSEEEDATGETYEFDGKQYATYLEMVQAKRQRNQDVLVKSGLLDLSATMSRTSKTGGSSKGIRKKKEQREPQESSRKSKRLRGEQAEGIYIDDERGGRFSFGGAKSQSSENAEEEQSAPPEEHYRGRINDGSDMTLAQATEAIGTKWFDEETSIPQAQELGNLLKQQVLDAKKAATTKGASPKSVLSTGRSLKGDIASSENENVDTLLDRVGRLSVGGHPEDSEEAEEAVAKVTPDRIYGIATHPSPDQLIICAGDKRGFVGIWNATSRQTQQDDLSSADSGEAASAAVSAEKAPDTSKDGNDQVHLFRFHSGAVNTIDWTKSGDAMLTTSYDGTCRLFNVETQSFHQLFAAYDDNETYAHLSGFGLDVGREFWFQSSCWDHRASEGKSFFVSTSVGTVLHVDTRTKPSLVWNEGLSEKKINTISLHPNGHSFISSGLDCTVSLWDLRKLGTAGKGRSALPIATYSGTKSINSAYFSPNTGEHVLCTTMNNRLDLLRNFHLSTAIDSPPKAKTAKSAAKPRKTLHRNGGVSYEVVKTFPHDNMTGRWLSTFMARWHPADDGLFCVGSMQKPRNVHVYNLERQVRAIPGLTAVVSRCCFHPSPHELILVGGNSSGRVTYFKEQKE